MPAPYSNDFRSKAIAAVARGERKSKVAEMFNISRNTLDLWLKRVALTGNCRPIQAKRCNHRQKIKDWERFREFVSLHGDQTQARMAQVWGEGVTQQNISDALKKIGWSRKKRPMGIASVMKPNEPPLLNV